MHQYAELQARATDSRTKDISTVGRGHGLAVWTVNRTSTGKVRSVAEYLDTETGEIIPASAIALPTLDLRTKQAEKDAVLVSLQPEVRKLAYFVLGYANKRRGITPGIKTLCQWYADLHGKRTDNVRRHIPKLEAAGILAGESLLGPLWQRTGGTARSHLGEDSAAAARYMMQRARQSFDTVSKSRPAWLAHAKPTGNVIAQDAYRALMARIMSPGIVAAL
ncbi:hypothetical protein RM96_10170 [Cupriavidus sp. IDO]|nr:hypothetical protein RM96_10170 [Cupriavidus sp. IDO]